jgi:hypothetical protein
MSLPHHGVILAPWGVYPVRLEGEPTEPLSRWLWLVKWLPLIPHFICLLFLFVTLVLAAIAAFFVLLFTDVGVLVFDVIMGFNRWVMRVAAYGLLMTPRYPPFRVDSGAREPLQSL